MRDDQLTNEAVYEQVRADRLLWERQKATGLTRRQLLKLAASGAAVAAFGAHAGLGRPVHAMHSGSIVKPTPPDQFRILGSNAEMLWERMVDQGYVVPNELFFVRNHTRTPHVDIHTWRLRIVGSGVAQPLELSYDDLLGLPAVTETKFIECAGNGRSFYGSATGSQWRLGAIGVADWTGVRLSTVLELAGLKASAVDVMPEGVDAEFLTGLPPNVVNLGHIRRPFSIEKALEDDTLLVYQMNGVNLPEDHGFPVRMLVPGWVGIANIKWLGRIAVAEEPLFSPWNTTMYRLFGTAYPDQPVLTEQEVKSAFELPWAATVPVGTYTLTGRSWSGHHKIEAVDVSFDGGTTWVPATLEQHNVPRAWRRWSVVWHAQVGQTALMARARDKKGHVQPASVPFNTQGYLFWAVVRHPVTVV